jgi:excisionase family DNA binding protein
MDEIMTVEEVATYLKVSKNTVRRWCLKGKLPGFKIEREWRIYKKELERVIRQSSCGQEKMAETLWVVDEVLKNKEQPSGENISERSQK